jgi:hypothetical protein
LATWGKRGEMDNISTAPVSDPSRRNLQMLPNAHE